VNHAIDIAGSLTIVVDKAGVADKAASISEQADEDWHSVMDLESTHLKELRRTRLSSSLLTPLKGVTRDVESTT
jgi:hypothetical protein